MQQVLIPELFGHEDDYDFLISKYANEYQLPFEKCKALIALESEGFNENLIQNEKHLNDASFGLCQILYQTARGLGFFGNPHLLLVPDTNIKYGLKFLQIIMIKYKDIDKAIVSYNMGHPHPAFGTCQYGCKLGDGQTPRQAKIFGMAKEGWIYANQPYLDRVNAYAIFYKYKNKCLRSLDKVMTAYKMIKEKNITDLLKEITL